MCSQNDEEENEIIQNISNMKLPLSDVCRKCKSEYSKIVLRGADVYCNSCFLIYFIHKFRSTIGKSKQIKPKDRILIGISGGANSTALLHLTHHGLDEISHKKLRFSPSFIYIDETSIDPSLDSSTVSNICSAVVDFNFSCYCVNLDEVFSQDKLCITEHKKGHENVKPNKRFENELKNFMTGISSSTSQEDAVTQLKNELICRTASALGFNKVFLADSCSGLSVKILSDVALGRGSQLSSHVHFKSEHFGVQVFRPMRELLENEIQYYLDIENIEVPSKNLKIASQTSSTSLITCTRDFLNGLQADFPATIPTVFKTGNKLVAGNLEACDSSTGGTSRSTSISEAPSDPTTNRDQFRLSDDGTLCIFCGYVKDTHANSASALEAVNVSRLMSTLQPSSSIIEKLENEKSELKNVQDQLSVEELRKNLCYGCANIIKEKNCVDSLPNRVTNDSLLRREMLNQIGDFLL